ncbi:hypothetical protein NQD34_013432 [Periophthalmus magnuspinnatus]|nr:hypothetical protein NQD34_013432 [Periophthalmus magnuspinnatus]
MPPAHIHVVDVVAVHPDPRLQSAGVVQPHPYVLAVGHLGPLPGHALQVRLVDEPGQVAVVSSAVVQSLLEGFVLIHQDEDVWTEQVVFMRENNQSRVIERRGALCHFSGGWLPLASSWRCYYFAWLYVECIHMQVFLRL